MKGNDCGDFLTQLQEELDNTDTLVFVDDVHLNVAGTERVSKIAEEAAHLLRQMKIPITSIYSDPKYYPKEELDPSSSSSAIIKKNWTTIVVAGIAFHLNHDMQMALPFAPFPVKKTKSPLKSQKTIGRSSGEKTKKSQG